jgi:hypothetical protein
MFLLSDQKKIAELILKERVKKPEEKEVPQGLEADFSKAHEAVAKDLMNAVKADDAKGVCRAMKSFYHLCEKESEYSVEVGE